MYEQPTLSFVGIATDLIQGPGGFPDDTGGGGQIQVGFCSRLEEE